MVLDAESETFVVHVVVLKAPEITILLSQIAQITGVSPVQIVALK